jgi:hypothetical protein
MEQSSVETDHSSRTDGMYGWNRAVLKLTTVPEHMVCMYGTEQC